MRSRIAPLFLIGFENVLETHSARSGNRRLYESRCSDLSAAAPASVHRCIGGAAAGRRIPYDLDEAAIIDGCSIWGVFFRIIVPLLTPAVATIGIYTFLQCWNELMFANVFISKDALKTLPVGIQALSGQYTTNWGPIGAALAIATFPTLLVYVFLSKRIQSSFIAGAVKG